MKLYRILPNNFVTNNRLNSKEISSVEYMYYKLGYTSFRGQRKHNTFNTLEDNIKEEGKYFFLFPEDSIIEGIKLMQHYHRYNCDTCLMVEYDVPIDIILKNIGVGDHTRDIMPTYFIETHIGKNDFGDCIVDDFIDNKNKLDILVQDLNETLKTIKMYGFANRRDADFYKDYFDVNNIDLIIDNEDLINRVLQRSNLYNAFINQHRELVFSPYITGKVVSINTRYFQAEFGDFDDVAKYYQEQGVLADYSSCQKEFKRELLYYIRSENQDKEKIKCLLKEKNYI